MSVYESVLEAARRAAIGSIWEPGELDTGDVFGQIADEASAAIAASLPSQEDLDPDWVAAIIGAKPVLLAMPTDGRTTGEALLGALTDLLLDELEPELLDHAREKGFDIPKPPTP